MENKFTKGKWRIWVDPNNGGQWIYSDCGGGDIICYAPEDATESMKNWEANAELIAEAGTVANETGKTPRQLVDENKELLEALEQIKKIGGFDSSGQIGRIINNAIQKATI